MSTFAKAGLPRSQGGASAPKKPVYASPGTGSAKRKKHLESNIATGNGAPAAQQRLVFGSPETTPAAPPPRSPSVLGDSQLPSSYAGRSPATPTLMQQLTGGTSAGKLSAEERQQLQGSLDVSGETRQKTVTELRKDPENQSLGAAAAAGAVTTLGTGSFDPTLSKDGDTVASAGMTVPAPGDPAVVVPAAGGAHVGRHTRKAGDVGLVPAVSSPEAAAKGKPSVPITVGKAAAAAKFKTAKDSKAKTVTPLMVTSTVASVAEAGPNIVDQSYVSSGRNLPGMIQVPSLSGSANTTYITSTNFGMSITGQNDIFSKTSTDRKRPRVPTDDLWWLKNPLKIDDMDVKIAEAAARANEPNEEHAKRQRMVVDKELARFPRYRLYASSDHVAEQVLSHRQY